MTTSTHKIFKLAKYTPFVILTAYVFCIFFLHVAFVVPTLFYFNYVFKFEHDQRYVVKRVYWIIRKDSRMIGTGIGTMHQTSAPWHKGKGIYIVAFKRCLQVGLCRPQDLPEELGILSAMQGRYLRLTPHEIGNWNAVPKESKAGAPTA